MVLVEQIASGKALPDEVVAQIVEHSDGVPLFVEELTKNVLESGLLREEADRYVLDRAPGLGAACGADRRSDWARVLI
jgi:predicted ATPase